jgi:hypothetical protein
MTRWSPERRFARNVLVAWFAWALSFFLPAAALRGFHVYELKGDIVFPGWQAAAICVVNPEGLGLHGHVAHLFRLMGLTNVVMAGALATLVTSRRTVRHAFMFLAAGSAFVDAMALVWFHEMLSYGYGVWLASFVTMALALSRDQSASRPF